MELKLTLRNIENVGEITPEKARHFTEIFEALIVSGGLSGVKGGSTKIHFGPTGEFMGIQLDYWPFRRRR